MHSPLLLSLAHRLLDRIACALSMPRCCFLVFCSIVVAFAVLGVAAVVAVAAVLMQLLD